MPETDRLDLAVPGADRREFVLTVMDAVQTYARTHDNDLGEAGGVFYDRTAALLERCDYHDGAALLLSTLAAHWLSQALARDGLTLTELRANRDRDNITIGVVAHCDGEDRNLEAVCPVCRHAARYTAAIGNDDPVWADQILHAVTADRLYPAVVASLLSAACAGRLSCSPTHFTDLETA